MAGHFRSGTNLQNSTLKRSSATRPSNFRARMRDIPDGHALAGECNGTFADDVQYSVGNNPQTVATADFNVDGQGMRGSAKEEARSEK